MIPSALPDWSLRVEPIAWTPIVQPGGSTRAARRIDVRAEERGCGRGRGDRTLAPPWMPPAPPGFPTVVLLSTHNRRWRRSAVSRPRAITPRTLARLAILDQCRRRTRTW